MNAVLNILNYRFYVKEFLLLFLTYFFMEDIFAWIFVRNSIYIQGYQKALGLLIYAFMLYKVNYLKKDERVWIGIFTLVMVRLVLESLLKYDTVFKQLTMFTVLFPVIFALYIKYSLRSMQLDLLGFIAKFYMITYLVFMVLFGRGFSFSLEAVEMEDYGPFSGDSRVVHASHIFMMTLPFLTTRRKVFLLPVFLCVLIILVHQHRSVWSSTLLALFFYLIASIRNGVQSYSGVGKLSFGIVAVLLLAYFFADNLAPGFVEFLGERFSEIFDPSKEGSTGNFRIEQRDVYGAMVIERPIFGWTFEGFEMPNPLVDWWPDLSGQHFHEGYMEMLFYHGIVGLLLKYGFVFYLLYRIFSKNLSDQSIILASFGISGLLFSFNYVLPLMFFGHIGMCLYYFDQDKEAAELDEVDEDEDDDEYEVLPSTLQPGAQSSFYKS
ncbi:MAG: O-antigen ligase family protein [Chitinophagaceae bacterium]